MANDLGRNGGIRRYRVCVRLGGRRGWAMARVMISGGSVCPSHLRLAELQQTFGGTCSSCLSCVTFYLPNTRAWYATIRPPLVSAIINDRKC